jgi:hypothetical protein
MKKFATIAISLWASAVVSHAQGTINFANAGAGFLAQVHIDTITGPLVTSTSYMAQLLLVGAGNSLTAIGAPAPFLGSGGPGFFNGGVVDSGLSPAGATGTFQVFAWDGASGQAAYAVALAAWNGGSIHGGYSNPVTVPTGGAGSPAGPPGALTGLQPWAVTVVPEPSTIALGIIGGLALLLRRRK